MLDRLQGAALDSRDREEVVLAGVDAAPPSIDWRRRALLGLPPGSQPANSSRPLSQQAHQHHPDHQCRPTDRGLQQRGIHQLATGQDPIPYQHPHDTRVEQDPCRQRIQRRDRDDRGWVVAVEGAQHAEADGHTERGDEGKGERQEEFGREQPRGLRGQAGDTGAQGEAFKELVEEDYDEESGVEGVGGDD